MTYNINQPAATMSDAEVNAYLNNLRREIGDEIMASSVTEWCNCTEIELGAEGCDIHVANPHTGHCLNADSRRGFVNFMQTQ